MCIRDRYTVRAQRPEHGRLNLQVGDRRLRAYVAHDGLRRYVAMGGETWMLERPQPQQKRRGTGAGGPSSGQIEAAMPGLVLDVLVAEGDHVCLLYTSHLVVGARTLLNEAIAEDYGAVIYLLRCLEAPQFTVAPVRLKQAVGLVGHVRLV